MRKVQLVVIGTILLFMVACQENNDNEVNDSGNTEENITPVSFVLEWTPNTNHTGIYVAQEKGFFEEENLEVDIMLPGEVGSEQLIATGKGDFGISVQERVFTARDEGIPIVSIAAVIQENTAGYASAVEEDITEPADFEGRMFGGVGTDLERAMMETIMEEAGADYDQVDFTNIGDADFFTAIKRDIDFSLVYQGWTGIEAELREQDLNMIYLKDFTEALNFYTPVLATSEAMIADNPEVVEAFVQAAVKGYEYAIEHPEEAAEILVEQVPDLDEELVKQSQAWLSAQYQGDADQFGIQEKQRWEIVEEFMVENDIIANPIDVDEAFTNEFLKIDKED